MLVGRLIFLQAFVKTRKPSIDRLVSKRYLAKYKICFNFSSCIPVRRKNGHQFPQFNQLSHRLANLCVNNLKW